MALSRLKQGGLKVEAAEGVEETLVAADYSINYKSVELAVMIGEYVRDLSRATLSELATIKGGVMAKLTWNGIEAVGGTKTVEGVWARLLRGCGFARTAAQVVDVGAVSGAGGAAAFTCGALFGNNAVQGSATKFGRVIKFVAGSPNKVIYEPVTGTFVSTDVFNVYSGGTAAATTSSAPTAAGHIYRPTSESDAFTPASLTQRFHAGGQIFPVIGARGKMSFEWKTGQPLLMNAEMSGLLKLTAGNIPTTGGVMAAVPALPVPPKIQKGFPFVLDAYSPVATSLSIDIGNDITNRETIGLGAGDVTDQGYFSPRITKRTITGSTDPEQAPVATKEWYSKSINGTNFPVLIETGLVSDTNGCIIAYGPTAQITGDMSQGDRGGIIINDLALKFPGDIDDEFVLFHVWT